MVKRMPNTRSARRRSESLVSSREVGHSARYATSGPSFGGSVAASAIIAASRRRFLAFSEETWKNTGKPVMDDLQVPSRRITFRDSGSKDSNGPRKSNRSAASDARVFHE
ncbi:hypothetical protein KM043_004161 [Ampulex compressa]|nr:hypothetical protein KM043_004161 [Ampulex compressa]